MPPNKAILGKNALAHESGIHTDGTFKDDRMYEPYPPEVVGRERRFVLGKHAGRASVQAVLDEHGVDISEEELVRVVEWVKRLSEHGRVTKTNLFALIEETPNRADPR